MFWLPYSPTPLIIPSLNLLYHSKTDARFMEDAPKAVWSIPYVVSVTFFPCLKHNFITYHSSKVSSRPDCIFEIHLLWESGFRRVYSNSCCSCSFEAEIIKIGQSSYKMYSNNIVNFQESPTILNACTKKFWKLMEGTSFLFREEILSLLLLGRVDLAARKETQTWSPYSIVCPISFFHLFVKIHFLLCSLYI